MQIPARFKLLGQTIDVEYDDTLIRRDDSAGMAEYRTNRIVLQPPTQAWSLTHEQLCHTFCHELVHWILYYAGSFYKGTDGDLHTNEGLVDMAGGLLHQALTTMEYDKDRDV